MSHSLASEADPDALADHVHALRVGTRRAGVALAAFRPVIGPRDARPATRIVRSLRRAAGALRDCDVHGALFADLTGRGASGHVAAADHALALLAQDRVVAGQHLREALTRYTPASARAAARRIERAAPGRAEGDETLADLGIAGVRALAIAARRASAADLSVSDNLHTLRLAMKRLRYTSELFAPVLEPSVREAVLPELERAQQVFGEANDVSTLVDRLSRYVRDLDTAHPTELPSDARQLRADLADLRDRFVAVRDLRFDRAASWWHASTLPSILESLSPGPLPAPEPTTDTHPVADAPVLMEPAMTAHTTPHTAHANGRHATAVPSPSRQRNLWLSGRRMAVIDIGSNSIRLLAVELIDDHSWKTLAEERAMTRLAQGLTRTGDISAEAMARSVEAIGRFKAIADRLGVSGVRAFATAAVREAGNRADFISLVRDRTGLTLEIVSAREEGKLTHRSVARVFDLTQGTAAVADMGGGSLEVVLSRHGVITGNTSMPLGAVRLTETLGGADACAGLAFQKLRARVERTIARRVPDGEVPPTILVGCGGTFTSLLTLAAASRGVLIERNSPALSTLGPVSRAQIKAMIDDLRKLSLEERLRVPGLPSDRADIVIAGLVVIERLMRHLGSTQLHVHPGGFREGLLLRMIDDAVLESSREALDAPDADHMTTVREFAARCQYEKAHSEHVARLALRLYDQFKEESVLIRALGSDRHERLLLEAAAVLHDVGVMVSYPRHHKHSQTIVRHADLAGLTPRETEIIAQLCRYHRRAEPRYKHRAFAALCETDRDLVRRLAAILRAADGLDRSHTQVSRDVRVRFGVKEVHFAVDSDGDPSADIDACRDKSGMLADLLGVDLTIERSLPPAKA